VSQQLRTVSRVNTVELIDAVRSELATWGWVQLVSETEEGLDLVAAFEVVSQVSLQGATPEEDRIAGAFAAPALDDALGLVAQIVGSDPDDGPLPAQRWAWVHTLTTFNDSPTTTARDIDAVLGLAGEVARARLGQ
jgi:hypothetical protein